MSNLNLKLLQSFDMSLLEIADLSVYTANPVNATLEVTPPDGFSKIAVTFVPRTVNIYNPVSLGISSESCTWLPDGVYYIKYSISPNVTNYIEKNFMRTAVIENKYELKFLSVDNECACGHERKRLKNELRDVRMLIDGAIAAANQCDIANSNLKYKAAWTKLEQLSPCNC